MSSEDTPRNVSPATQGPVNLGEIRHAISNARSTFTRVRTQRRNHVAIEETAAQADFITLVSVICNIYRDSENSLIPMQQFHPDAERHEDGGHTCVVSQRAISTSAASNLKRGTTDSSEEDIVVKRTRQSVLEPRSSGVKSLINELSIRTHPPIRGHPNIVKFKGIAWDFEDDKATKPRPLLLEELAPQRSLEGFWNNYNFVRMTFQSKIELCLDIAEGLAVLHACHVVHGDVKPENILIFPRIGHQDSFMAKLTDFGHSTPAHEKRTTLPAFTEQWCAPEVLMDDHYLDFEGMIATDVYSFGLVMLSIFIGRSYYKSFDDYTTLKREGKMFTSAMGLVEWEDQQSHDSDFELDTIRALLRATIGQRSKQRTLSRCLRILKRYLATRDGSSNISIPPEYHSSPTKLRSLNLNQEVSVGYQSLALCSHQLKSRVVHELELIAKNESDARKSIAAWELSICYFSGFGLSRDFTISSRWLTLAACGGIPAATAFSFQLHKAMRISSQTSKWHLGGSAVSNSPSHEQLQHPPNHEQQISIDRRAMEMFTQNDSQDAVIIADQARHFDSEENEDLDLDSNSDTQSVLSDSQGHGHRILLDERVITAIGSGQPEVLATFISETPDWSIHQSSLGDPLLLLAARSGNYESMEILLGHESADASIYNDFQESALHLLSNFSEEQIRALVPKLIAKGADVNHEALPIHYGDSLLNISAYIRSCPILRAILNDNIALLNCLLEVTHKNDMSTICRICEGGSRLKRIIAIALSTFRAQAIRKLIDHITTHNRKGVNFGNIEVWSNQKLIPLWKTPFRSVIIKTTDLPEAFFRAISYGEKHIEVLRSTLSFILDQFPNNSKQLYYMLQEAVEVNSLDAVDFILEEAKRRQLRPSWWLAISKNDFPHNPLITAIKNGLRDVFERLWSSNHQVFREFVQVTDEIGPSRIARLFLNASSSYTKNLFINVAQICLSIAITAAHQDQYFFNFILENSSRKLFVQQPGTFDDEFGNHPTCFLAQAILTSSFSAATAISQKFPEAWQHRVKLQGPSREKMHESTLSAMKLFPREYLGYSAKSFSWLLRSAPKALGRFVGGEYWTISSPTLPEYVLLVGSYRHCRFLLEHLHASRSTKKGIHLTSTKSKSSLTVKAEAGIRNHWEHCQLTPKEFWCLMLGNIVREREDREDLWNVIHAQVSDGHVKKMVYLRLAIRHGTKKALVQLLDMGWQVNGPFWAYFMTPYSLSTCMERQTNRILHHAPENWANPRWGDLDTHKGVFKQYKMQQEKIYANYRQLAKQMSGILKERGGKMPKFVLWLRNDRTYLQATVLYALMYGLFLPLILTFSTGPHWKWRKPLGQKLAWMYLWSLGAVLFPPVIWFKEKLYFFTSQHIMVQVLLLIQLLLQHLVPLILITSVELESRGWFAPFFIIFFEALIVLSGCALYFLSHVIGATLDGCWVLVSYFCGKGFRPGPLGLL